MRSPADIPPDAPARRSSARARWALAALVAGYVAVAVVAAVPNSPLTVLLPAGVHPPSWAVRLASAFGLGDVRRTTLIGPSLLIMVVLTGAFGVLVWEARLNRVRLATVLVASALCLAVAAAAPLLLSRDVYTYAAYGRMMVLDHRDPYAFALARFPHDPFVRVASAQWLHLPSRYGPLSTLIDAAVVRASNGSRQAAIQAFKVIAGVAVAAAAGLAAVSARAVRPQWSAMAAAMVGLNPVLVVHTVGGGHVDALIAAPLAGAMAVVVTDRRAVRRARSGAEFDPGPFRRLAVTALLTLACLVKVEVVPPLILWLWWTVGRTPKGGRLRVAGEEAGVVVVLSALFVWRFVAGGHAPSALAAIGGTEVWASPARLVARAAQGVLGQRAGAVLGGGLFLVVELVVVLRLARGRTSARAVPDAWGTALLAAALAAPFLLPWYVAWFAPFLGLMSDDRVRWCGVVAAELLALTLIPADPFHGFTTPGVMVAVHFVVAPCMAVLFGVVVARVLTPRSERSAPA